MHPLPDARRHMVAIYWDFENIHAALVDEKYGDGAYRKGSARQSHERLANVRAIMDYVATLGDVSINRAYANWLHLASYREDLNDYTIDLVQIFPRGAHAKNGADIRIVLDALEDVHHFPHLTHLVVIGGDSDYISLAQKLRQAGKVVIGIGVRASTNPYWVQACNEFKFYQTLLTKAEKEVPSELLDEADEPDLDDARELLQLAVKRLIADEDSETVVKSSIKPMMLRLDPTFDEANYGFRSFSRFLEACRDLVSITQGEHDHMVSLVEKPAPPPAKNGPAPQPSGLPAGSTSETYLRIVKKQGIRPVRPGLLDAGLAAMREAFARRQGRIEGWAMLEQDLAAILAESGRPVDQGEVRKLRHMVFRARLFRMRGDKGGIQLDPGLDAATLLRKVMKAVIRRIALYAERPLDEKAVLAVLHGDDQTHLPLVQEIIKEVERELG